MESEAASEAGERDAPEEGSESEAGGEPDAPEQGSDADASEAGQPDTGLESRFLFRSACFRCICLSDSQARLAFFFRVT